MAIKSKQDGNTAVVSVSGRLDAVTAPQYRVAIRELVDGGTTRAVIDFGELHYISSAGLAELLVSANLLKEKEGQFSVANVSPSVLSVFSMCGIEKVVTIHKSVADALAASA